MPQELTRRSILQSGGAAAGLGLVGSRPAHTLSAAWPAAGVNLAGAEFGAVPGMHGREYLYPPREHFDYFRALGFAMIRLPFKWERLQPELNAPFAAEEQKLLVATARHATSRGQFLVIDPHNYAKRRIVSDGWANEHLIGSPLLPISAFADFWSRLAALFKDDQRTIFGLMNEPAGIRIAPWLEAANAAIAAIRATGAENLIVVPGIEYTGAHSWLARGNTAMAAITDPHKNFAFDVHQYFDDNSSGTKPDAVSGTIGSERIAAFQDWARRNGFKAILGEFNGGRNPAGYNALNDLCQELTANSDVWLGWTAWAGGARWPDSDMFNLEPWRDGRMREQTAILAKYTVPSPTCWVASGAAIDLDLARHRFHGLPEPNTREMPLRASGQLLDLLQAGACTLVVETIGLEVASDILTMHDVPLLRIAQDGALEGPSGERTATQPQRSWRAKRRAAISFDRALGRLGIGVTGAAVTGAAMTIGAIDNVTVGSTSRPNAVTRITVYPRFFEPDALNALLA
jgi:endoglucanase